MRTALSIVRNFFILNVCAVLPALLVIYGHMPDRVDFDIQSKSPLRIAAGFVSGKNNGQLLEERTTGYLPGQDVESLNMYFPMKVEIDKFQFKLIGEDVDCSVKSVVLIRNLVLKYTLLLKPDGEHAFRAVDGRFVGITLPKPAVTLFLFALTEAVLLIFAFLALKFGTKESRDRTWKDSILVSFLFSLFFVVVLPCQTILTNRALFDFGMSSVCKDLLIFSLLIWIIAFVLLQIASIACGRWLHVLIVALLVYEYLQTGVLSIGSPAIDGDMGYYWRKGPMAIDAICFSVVVGVFTLLYRTIRSKMVFVGLALLLLYAASIGDVFVKSKRVTQDGSIANNPWRMDRKSIVKSTKYSPRRNVIFLVLDSIPSDAAYAIVQKDEKIRNSLDGFILFNNNVGMGDNTYLGTVGMLTGEFRADYPSDKEYAGLIWSTNSFYDVYLNAGYRAYISSGLSFSYSNDLTVKESKPQRIDAPSVFLEKIASMNLCLLDVVYLRAMPFALKRGVLQIVYLGYSEEFTRSETMLYPELSACGIDKGQAPSFLYYHTLAVHAPIQFDENGRRVYKRDNYAGLEANTHFVLKSVVKLLESFKRKGIYDNSLIVLVADHGSCFDRSHFQNLSELPARAVPFLWIKPEQSNGGFEVVNDPTSHAKLSALMKTAAGRKLTRLEILNLLACPIRRFTNYQGRQTCEEWIVDGCGRRIN